MGGVREDGGVESELVNQVQSHKRIGTSEHLFKFDTDSFAADLCLQRTLDFRIFHPLASLRFDGVVQSAGKSDQPQNSQRVIFEGLVRLERGADDLVGHVVVTFTSKVLNLACGDVVKHCVDGGIAS